ncbi:MAG TPA: bifunctional pyr operon transcriptional regulator/uracil phosphoribosyltransferase PyrR [Candidatus Binatia bacterium]|jgi:pyrimidine operon attenuation protein/uracil phosphoribosyltransferase
MTQEKQILFEGDELARTINRMGHEVVEKTDDPAGLVLIGIRSRGVHLARRIARKVEEIAKIVPPVGALDVTAYRDDRAQKLGQREAGAVEALVTVDDKTVVLIDDVIFRGRTIRAAMDAVAQFGQPRRILVGVLVDRGSRQLPIRADIVGKNVEAGEGNRVNVMLEESDGIDQISITRWQGRGAL